jgi:hypothetical protein
MLYSREIRPTHVPPKRVRAKAEQEDIVRKMVAAAAFLLFTLLAAASLRAHHSPSAIFDMSKHISVIGTLTRVDWVNPHIVLAMEARGEGGKIEQWRLESNPPSWYKSVGLVRADFAKAIGQQITVECVKARDGSLYGYMDKIKLPDGTSYELVNGNEAK